MTNKENKLKTEIHFRDKDYQIIMLRVHKTFYKQFKRITALKASDMTKTLNQFIKFYINKNKEYLKE